jgi:hypothetical protein
MIDLRKCVPGQKLRTKHGTILEYLGPSDSLSYPHLIRYPNGSEGTRCDDGFTYKFKRMDEDEDVVEILPIDKI